MKRRHFLQGALTVSLIPTMMGAVTQERFDDAASELARAVASGQVRSAVLHVICRDQQFTRHFGEAASSQAMFLLGSISKPICITALMTLFDQGRFQLDDPVQRYLPDFKDDGRERVTIQHLLTHTSGLPDQLMQNDRLRREHASLATFGEHAQRAPLSFVPGTQYQYSSMGILLASLVAERLSGLGIAQLVDQAVFQKLGMQHSAQGLGPFKPEEMVPCQTEYAAPESGGGDPAARDWDWNSLWWRRFGAPWGGTHASAPDLGLFLTEFLELRGTVVKPETARRMRSNQNAPLLTPRGLGFQVTAAAGAPGCSESTFGHSGSTGTLAWCDPASDTICVVLTSLPGRAVDPHPRDLAARHIAARQR